MNEGGFLNLRRFAGLIQQLKQKDFDLYCIKRSDSIESINENVSAINVNNNNYIDDVKTQPRFSDFMEMKDQYYAQQLGDGNVPDIEQMTLNYVKMVQWTLFYYYRSTCSWSEYYPHDCAPFVSDFGDIHRANLCLEFINKPANVFAHLLAILPTRSAHLLPRCYQLEMFDDQRVPVIRLL